MKRWALLTVLLYLAALAVLGAPLYFLLDGEETEWMSGFFLWVVPVLVVIQAVLLLVPVQMVRERPVRKRAAVTSAVVGALPMGVLLGCFVSFLLLMLLGEEDAGYFMFGWPVVVLTGLSWFGWGVLFHRRFTADEPGAFVENITGWLLKGSILEVLVAIPSHIVSRNRDDCCAPGFTFLGIATGLAIALLSFGPGLFYLFARKVKDKRGRPE